MSGIWLQIEHDENYKQGSEAQRRCAKDLVQGYLEGQQFALAVLTPGLLANWQMFVDVREARQTLWKCARKHGYPRYLQNTQRDLIHQCFYDGWLRLMQMNHKGHYHYHTESNQQIALHPILLFNYFISFTFVHGCI